MAMKWHNERWVKLYTKDTIHWRALPWEARGIFCLMLRMADSEGEIDMSSIGIEGVAVALGAPLGVVKVAIDALVKTKTVEVHDDIIVIPNFVDAQQSRTSNAERQRRYRDRKHDARVKSDAETVTSDVESDGVTLRVTGSNVTVTSMVTSPLRNEVTNRIEENREEFNPPYTLPAVTPAYGQRATDSNPTQSELEKKTPIPGPPLPQESIDGTGSDLGPIQETKTLPRARERPRHVRLDQSAFLKQAYADGIKSVTGKAYSVSGRDMVTLDDAVDGHAPSISGKHIDWLRQTVETFAKDVSEDAAWLKYSGGLSPKGFLAWLNEGRHLREPEKPKSTYRTIKAPTVDDYGNVSPEEVAEIFRKAAEAARKANNG